MLKISSYNLISTKSVRFNFGFTTVKKYIFLRFSSSITKIGLYQPIKEIKRLHLNLCLTFIFFFHSIISNTLLMILYKMVIIIKLFYCPLHFSRHSSCVLKLLALPLAPPYTNSSHVPVDLL